MISRILTIAWKELLHLRKDRVLIPFFLIGAVSELMLVAWATNQPIENVSMLVLDQDQSTQSAALIEALDETDTLTLVDNIDKRSQLEDEMAKPSTFINLDTAVIAIIIPENYGEDVATGNEPEVEVILNGAQSMSALEAKRTAQEVIFAQGMRERFGMEPEDYADQVPQITVRYNEDLHRSWYTLPSEMALMFYMMTVAIAALGISRERERGTYEQLLVMPFRPVEVILGKALTPMMVGYILFITMLTISVVLFGVPLRGSLILLLVLAVLYLLAEMGKGVLASMASKTQLQAFLLVFVVAMVDMIFSGYAVAVETMPPLLRDIATFVPIRQWLIIMRGIMLKDSNVSILYPHVLLLVAIGAVIISVTARQYRRSVS